MVGHRARSRHYSKESVIFCAWFAHASFANLGISFPSSICQASVVHVYKMEWYEYMSFFIRRSVASGLLLVYRSSGNLLSTEN